jgi:hypothetical protein
MARSRSRTVFKWLDACCLAHFAFLRARAKYGCLVRSQNEQTNKQYPGCWSQGGSWFYTWKVKSPFTALGAVAGRSFLKVAENHFDGETLLVRSAVRFSFVGDREQMQPDWVGLASVKTYTERTTGLPCRVNRHAARFPHLLSRSWVAKVSVVWKLVDTNWRMPKHITVLEEIQELAHFPV